jgi:hypothetical protein
VAPLIWDDFESGTNNLGQDISDVDSDWDAYASSGLVYANDWSHSGQISGKIVMGGVFDSLFPSYVRPTDELYMSGWLKTEGWDSSDVASDEGMAVKFFRMNNNEYNGAGNTSDTEYNGPLMHNFGYISYSAGADPALPTGFDFYQVPSVDAIGTDGVGTYYTATDWYFNAEPVRVEYFAKLNTPGVADGYAFSRHLGWDANEYPGLMQRYATSNLQLHTPLFMMAAAHPSATADFDAWGDDFYADTTQARIEICNVAWSQRANSGAHCEIQIPESGWDDTTGTNIQFIVNQGSFTQADSDNGLYLFVIDEFGDESNAYPITFGAVVPSVCGNSVCEFDEDYVSCPVDCDVPPVCGDGSVDVGESCDSCPVDVGVCSVCSEGIIIDWCSCEGSNYDSGFCCSDVFQTSSCTAVPVCDNDGVCETGSGEDNISCPNDCSITSICSEGIITSECTCGSHTYTSGYCCEGSFQPTECLIPPPPINIYDLTGEGDINFEDLVAMITETEITRIDFKQDGIINILDYLILINNFS